MNDRKLKEIYFVSKAEKLMPHSEASGDARGGALISRFRSFREASIDVRGAGWPRAARPLSFKVPRRLI